jgi:hypothetical protein
VQNASQSAQVQSSFAAHRSLAAPFSSVPPRSRERLGRLHFDRHDGAPLDEAHRGYPTRKSGVFAAEADDLIFTIVERARRAGNTDCIVISLDKDLYQVMSAERRVFFYGLRDRGFVSDADVKAKMGVRPDQIGDYLALLGDKVDMIPGITGLGGKRAARLLQEFDTLEGVYEAAVRAGDAPLGKYFPASVTAAVRAEMPRARRMRAEVIALREIDEPFDGHRFEFEQLQAALKTPV